MRVPAGCVGVQSSFDTSYIFMFVVLPDGSVSSIHAAGYGARPRTRLRTASAVVLKLMRQVSLKIFGAGLS